MNAKCIRTVLLGVLVFLPLTLAATGTTNVVTSPDEASLSAAMAAGGWVSIGFNGTLTFTNPITVTNNVILDGSQATATFSGGGAVQLFYVTNGSLTLSNLTLSSGNNTYGGAISSQSSAITLVNCVLTNNHGFNGGAIYNNGGTLTLLNTRFSNNAVGTGNSAGGAIYQTAGTLTASNCLFASNQGAGGDYTYAPASGGALALGGTATLANSQLINNVVGAANGSPTYGGAIVSSGTLILNDCTLTGNAAYGGEIFARSPPGADGWADGGAIYNTGTAILNRCAIYSNSVVSGAFWQGNPYGAGNQSGPACGGGICNLAQCFATNCTIAFNRAQWGGLDPSTPYSSSQGLTLGGGIFNGATGTFTAMSLTVSSNTCDSKDSQISLNFQHGTLVARGAEIANSNGTFQVQNCIIGYTNPVAVPGLVSYEYQALQTTYNGFPPGYISDVYGPLTDAGHNLCTDETGPSSMGFTNPILAAAMGYYGGATPCLPLLAGSPAIDAGDPNNFPRVDQRNYARPAGTAPDIGAYEYGAVYTVPSDPYHLSIAFSGTNLLVSFIGYSNSYRLQYSSNLLTWTDLATNGPITAPTNLSQTVGRKNNSGYFRVAVP